MKRHQQTLALLLAASLSLSACMGTVGSKEVQNTQAVLTESSQETEIIAGSGIEPEPEIVEEPENLISVQQLASSIREKYIDEEKYIYLSPEYDLPRNHYFTDIEMFYHPLDMGFEYTTDMFGIFADPEFKHAVRTSFDIEQLGENHYAYTLKPGQRGAGVVSTTMFENGETISLGDGYHVHQQDPYDDWGNLNQYYFVQWVDLKTGEKLEKPIVKIFTIKAELETPEVEYQVLENGSPKFSWQEIDGADIYYVLKMDSYNGWLGSASVIARTTETSWSPENNDINSMNSKFHNSSLKPDHELDTESDNGSKDEPYDHFYAVIASGENGISSMSRLLTEREVISRLPYRIDDVAMREAKLNKDRVDYIGLMPVQVPVTMCDNRVVMKMISYDINNANIKPEVWGTFDLNEKGERINMENVVADVLHVPYIIEGTTFRSTLKIDNFDENTYKYILKLIAQRQADLKGRNGSDNSLSAQVVDGDDEELAVADEIAVTEDAIFATSALGEYLAVNMLAGNRAISLEDFPESSDQELLIDAWSEAIYQNPLILGVNGMRIARDNNCIWVSYDDDKKTIKAKQEEIRREVARVAAEIITPDMTALEKEIAINNYLCDSAEYDFEALENAEKYNFESVDKEYNDAFTPYGILINKVGVCASYAGSFKLLADAAGLETIVVTGYLEGSLPHAWNRVRIDEEWITVDTTNNDNPMLVNAILNLPDHVAELMLVEDDRYMGNRYIKQYTATTDNSEYYHITERYYSIEEITGQLVEALQTDGSVTLRTDYTLDDVSFQMIAQQVISEMELDNIYGFHWMGVITMALEPESLMN